jgi:hypothetical protein
MSTLAMARFISVLVIFDYNVQKYTFSDNKTRKQTFFLLTHTKNG